jgi:hypothetical protein
LILSYSAQDRIGMFGKSKRCVGEWIAARALYRNFGDKNLVAVSHADAYGGNWLG